MERVHQFLGGKTSIWDCAAKRMPSWAAIISAWKSPIVCEMFPAPAFATSLFLMTAPPSPSPPRFSFECSINIDFHDTCWRPNPFLDHLVTERWIPTRSSSCPFHLLTLFLSTIGTTEHMLSSVAFQCLQFTNQIRRWWVCAKLALTCSSPNVPPSCIASLLTWTTKTGEHHPRPICYTWHT